MTQCNSMPYKRFLLEKRKKFIYHAINKIHIKASFQEHDGLTVYGFVLTESYFSVYVF